MAKKNDNGSSDRAGKSGTSANTSASATGSNGSSVGSGGIESESGSVGNGKSNAETKSGIGAIDSGRGDKSSGNASAGTSEGTGSDSGSGRDNIAGTGTGTGKRKRGRPKGSTNRQRNAEDISRVNAPKSIDTSILGTARKRGKRDYTKPFAKSFKLLFELPRYAGYGEHWPIDDPTANELGSKLNECVDAFPAGATTKFAQWFEKYVDRYMPFAALGIVMYAVTEPRIALTKQLIENARQQNNARAPETTARDTASSGAMSSGIEGAPFASDSH
jgi:hypothetical protein